MIKILSYPLDEVDYSAEDAQLYNCTRTNGVYSSDTDYIVTAIVDQPLQIAVSTGLAWMRFSNFAGIVTANKESVIFNLNSSHSSLTRIDRVVIRYDIIANTVGLDVKTGVPSISPVAPSLQRNSSAYELGIADIIVRSGQSTLTAASITDRRLSDDLCGIMSDGVTKIPTETLYNQWYTWFSELQEDWTDKAQILQDWIDVFQEEFGDNAEAWFTTRDEIFNTWLNGLGGQISNNVGSAFIGFAIEDRDLQMYYSTGIDPYSFYIEDDHLFYVMGEDAIGGTITSEINQLKDRLDAIESSDIMNLIAEISG